MEICSSSEMRKKFMCCSFEKNGARCQRENDYVIRFWRANDNRTQIKGETHMKLTSKNRYTRFVALLAVGMIAAIGAARAGGWWDDNDQLAQSAELEKLHAAFHAAVSVHDPVNGDSAAVITQRIRDAIALWSRDGEITIVSTAPTAGNYIGTGDPDDPATCPEPTGDTSATGQQGTICT